MDVRVEARIEKYQLQLFWLKQLGRGTFSPSAAPHGIALGNLAFTNQAHMQPQLKLLSSGLTAELLPQA